jgi:aryl-alcohol dehydrogenase-like predicted oxidoreductase
MTGGARPRWCLADQTGVRVSEMALGDDDVRRRLGLRRLRSDHIDLLWVHARDTLTPVPEIMRALDDQVRAGKVLYVGVSDWPAWEIAQANTLAELRGWTTGPHPRAGSTVRRAVNDDI